MSKQIAAAERSQRREDTAPNSTNPGSESRPFGVAADRDRLTEALEGLARVVDRFANASESQIQKVPPKALSRTAAAEYLGITPKSLDHLVRTRKLAYVQPGDQRGRVFLIEDLDDFLMQRRQAAM